MPLRRTRSLTVAAQTKTNKMAVVGLEHPPLCNGKTANHSERDAKTDATAALSAIPTEPSESLKRLLAVWPMLSFLDREELADRAQAYSTAEFMAETETE